MLKVFSKYLKKTQSTLVSHIKKREIRYYFFTFVQYLQQTSSKINAFGTECVVNKWYFNFFKAFLPCPMQQASKQ